MRIACIRHEHIKAETKWPPFLRRQVYVHFREWWILDTNSSEYVLLGLINDIIALIQVMAWRRTGEKPFCESMVVCFADAYMRRSASVSWIRIFID